MRRWCGFYSFLNAVASAVLSTNQRFLPKTAASSLRMMTSRSSSSGGAGDTSKGTGSQMDRIGKLHPSSTTLLVCDIQERFMPLIPHATTVVQTCRYLVNAARLLHMPIVVTQQYTKAFGPTVPECLTPMRTEPLDNTTDDPIKTTATAIPVFEKKLFSMITPDVQAHLNENTPVSESFLIVGIEAHVCVQQTCLDLLEQGKAVHLIVDGVSSQQVIDRTVALQRLAAAGVHMTTAQSAVFMLLQSADHPQFKAVSKLTTEHMKLPNTFNTDARGGSAL